VLPQKPLRQWVLSLPFALRVLFATDSEALTQVLGSSLNDLCHAATGTIGFCVSLVSSRHASCRTFSSSAEKTSDWRCIDLFQPVCKVYQSCFEMISDLGAQRAMSTTANARDYVGQTRIPMRRRLSSARRPPVFEYSVNEPHKAENVSESIVSAGNPQFSDNTRLQNQADGITNRLVLWARSSFYVVE
jgi:hypothetical protein